MSFISLALSRRLNMLHFFPATLFACLSLNGSAKEADKVEQLFNMSLKDLLEVNIVTGTRTKNKKISESPTPIDIFDIDEINFYGSGDTAAVLKELIPSYNATFKTGDGNAFVYPTSLRGLAPDSMLLLLNSKRRHRSALIQHGGPDLTKGSHAPDPGPLPLIAFKNIELLRDGAASQYGSDAIAGVLNFILKDNDEGGLFQTKLGGFYEGEQVIEVALNKGLNLFENGFLNFSLEYQDYEQLIRGIQPASAQAAIDAGNPNIGLDSPYDGDSLAQTWGRPENHGLRTAWNIGLNLSNEQEFYAFGNFADFYGNFRFFYRPLSHPNLQPIPIDPADPSQGNFCWCDSLPGGYTPFFESRIRDYSKIVGLRGKLDNGSNYDVSVQYGYNHMDFTLNNTLNPSLGPFSPRDFDPGDLTQKELNINIDFSYPYSDTLNIAYGFEWRKETYIMHEGQLESWQQGPWAEVYLQINPVTGEPYTAPFIGSHGYPGTSAESAGTFNRSSYAIYGDSEWNINPKFLLQTAIRLEDYSDFGQTSNGKLAALYHLSEDTSFRSTLSTGFRAPTPGQINYTGIRTSPDNTTGGLVEDGTILPTSDLARSLGGKALGPEKSINFTIGMISNLSNRLNSSIDFYWIRLRERIVKTIDLPVDNNPRFSRASFYTNAVSSRTIGIDFSTRYLKEWSESSRTKIRFSYNYNDNKVTGQKQVNGINPLTDDTIFNFQNMLPNSRAILMSSHSFNDDWTLRARASHYGRSYDERATNEVSRSRTLIDFELNYTMFTNLDLVFGASNLLDTYPSRMTVREENGLLYSQKTPIGYNGGMVYFKILVHQ